MEICENLEKYLEFEKALLSRYVEYCEEVAPERKQELIISFINEYAKKMRETFCNDICHLKEKCKLKDI